MSDRHPKWVRVEPGTVIPAGQPYRIEPGERAHGHEPDWTALEQNGKSKDWKFNEDGWLVGYKDHLFVDSSWKPPLVLPETPTWGIAVRKRSCQLLADRWMVRESGRFMDSLNASLTVAEVLDFIPLTDEQVKRIEAAR